MCTCRSRSRIRCTKRACWPRRRPPIRISPRRWATRGTRWRARTASARSSTPGSSARCTRCTCGPIARCATGRRAFRARARPLPRRHRLGPPPRQRRRPTRGRSGTWARSTTPCAPPWRRTTMTPPEGMNWDLFLGAAPEIPYHPAYHPFAWRGWIDFGVGAIGDMGAHLIDQPYTVAGAHVADQHRGVVEPVGWRRAEPGHVSDGDDGAVRVSRRGQARPGEAVLVRRRSHAAASGDAARRRADGQSRQRRRRRRVHRREGDPVLRDVRQQAAHLPRVGGQEGRGPADHACRASRRRTR